MKKLSLILALSLLFTVVTSSFAQEGALLPLKTGSNSADRESAKTANAMDNLRTRADKEITRRITFLTELSGKLDTVKKLSDADKTSLKSQIQTQINSLNALKVKIAADTDLVTLKADVKSIINGYYIFAYFRVKTSLYVAAGRLVTTSDTLNVVYAKLQTRVSELEATGTDTTALKALLSDMQLKIADAKTQYDLAISALNTLDVSGFPANKSSFVDIRSKLKLGAQDLRAAYKDAVSIRQALGDIRGNLKKGTFETKDGSGSGIIQ